MNSDEASYEKSFICSIWILNFYETIEIGSAPHDE